MSRAHESTDFHT
jgi:zinc transporter 7